ncbi:MAG: helix-turn-helix transcriptional regulator [Candidatus Cybelea sp.]
MIRLKLWRLQAKLTQAEAARQLGVGESTLAMLETGRLRPTQGQLEVLRKSFGLETDTLFESVRERVGTPL